MISGLVLALLLIFIGMVFGLPKYIVRSSALLILLLSWLASGTIPRDNIDRICKKIIKKIDAHLPCLQEISDAVERPTDRTALWSVIHRLCVPASYIGFSFPCLRVDRAQGYAVLRSLAQSRPDIIVAPTVFIEGVESLPAMRGVYPNLWKAGWISRDLLTKYSHRELAWNEVILAVNSKMTRSQDQLHLHVGCIDRKLRDFISEEAGRRGANWRFVGPSGKFPDIYLKYLNKEAVNSDVFAMINNEIPASLNSAELQTIALAGVEIGSWQGYALIVTLHPEPAERFLAPTC